MTKFLKNRQEIGSLLKKRREELGLTQEELAAILGVSTGYISKIESAKWNITLEVLFYFCEALKLELHFSETQSEWALEEDTLYHLIAPRFSLIVKENGVFSFNFKKINWIDPMPTSINELAGIAKKIGEFLLKNQSDGNNP